MHEGPSRTEGLEPVNMTDEGALQGAAEVRDRWPARSPGGRACAGTGSARWSTGGGSSTSR